MNYGFTNRLFLLILFALCVLVANTIHADDKNKITPALSGTMATTKHVLVNFKPLYLGEFELGGGFNSENSFKFGEYSGLQNRDGFVIGSIYLQERPNADSESTRYWTVNGRNLGLESRSIRGEYGHQGKGSVIFDFNQTPHYRWDDAKTPFIISGDTYNLPFDWVPGRNTAEMTKLDSSLHPVSIATNRNKYQFGANWQFNSKWSAKIQYFYEKRMALI